MWATDFRDKKQAVEARAGSEAAKAMVASIGKAKTLGDRNIGHVDPGSITMSLVLEGCAEVSALSLFRSDGIGSGHKDFILTRFLNAIQRPLRLKPLWFGQPRSPSRPTNK